MFGGYMLAGTLTLFISFRIIHGFSFGMVTVSGNTIVIDIMPSSRRGEGLGYYGLANNIAMSIGPMTGLFLHDAAVGYTFIFSCSLGACILGFLCAYLVKTPYKAPIKREPISLDRFILLKGIPAGISLLLLSIPYGITTNYVAMYAKQIGITSSSGFFFTLMAIGMAVSRGGFRTPTCAIVCDKSSLNFGASSTVILPFGKIRWGSSSQSAAVKQKNTKPIGLVFFCLCKADKKDVF